LHRKKNSTFLCDCAILPFSNSGDEILKLCEGMGLNGWLKKHWLVWALAAAVLLSGCSGVMFESKDEGGKVERLKVDSGEGWNSFDSRPRYPYSKRNSQEEMSIMLLKEMTF